MKFRITVILSLVIVLVLTGCGKKANVDENDSAIPEHSGEFQTAETTEDVDNTADEEFEKIEWPTSGIATMLPAPDWSDYGKIYSDSETMFWCDIECSALNDFTNYIEICKEHGFTENQHYTKGYGYYAETSDAQGVQITYNQWGESIGIEIRYDAESWDAYYKTHDVE